MNWRLSRITQTIASLFRGPIVLAANESLAGAFEGNAVIYANEEYATTDKENWVMLAPYGDHPNNQGLQKFDRLSANTIVQNWNSLPNLGVKVMGAPWYIGHPDVKEFRDRYKDTAAYGRIVGLDARDNGLFANVQWNDDGKAIIRAKKYHGHSVAWYMRPSVAGGGYTPFALRSVGFTNEPNIPVPPITAANEQDKNMITAEQHKELAKKLGLPETATADQIMESAGRIAANEAAGKTCDTELAELKKKHATTEATVAANEKEIKSFKEANATLTTTVSTLTTERDSAVKIVANERKERAKPLIDLALKEGKVTPADREKVELIFANEGFDKGIADLTSRGANVALHTKSEIDAQNRLSQSAIANKTNAGVLAVNEYMAKHNEADYNTAFEAVRAAKPELFQK